jgi:iron complex transport system ATP-binding protein
MQKIIEMENVTAYRGRTRVFRGLSLQIDRGQSTVILGPNGAGKSTLLKLLIREIYPVPASGSCVRVLGEECWNVWELRSHLGIVSSDLQEQYVPDAVGINVLLSGLYSSMDIWSHQTFTSGDRTRAESILRSMGVADCRDKYYAEMSTGEQRRFLLGRALIHNPDVLVLDEPTSGLDVKACFQYLHIVRDLMKRGKTVVLVTHHIYEIPPEIERVILLKAGRIVAAGPKKEILTSANLTMLFETPVELLQLNGFYQVMPAKGAKDGGKRKKYQGY